MFADDGGHMIGSRFRGIVEQINYFPQEIASNRYADWKNMEDEWEAVAKGKRLTRNGAVIVSAGTPRTVSVDIKPQFNGNSKRPTEFRVTYWYGGSTIPASTQSGNIPYKTISNL